VAVAVLDTLLGRLSRRHRWQLLIDQLAPRFLVAGLVVGTGVAAIRLALPAVSPLIPALVAAALLVPWCWTPALLRQRVARGRLAGELDLLAGTNGTAMALAEQPDAAWTTLTASALEQVAMPPLRWQPVLPALVALALLGGAVLLPQAEPAAPGTSPAAALVRPLREDLARLAEAGVITRPEQQELVQRVDDLLAHAGTGALDQATWEGLDRLQAGLDAQATAAGEHLAAALAAAQAGVDQPPKDAAQAGALADQLATTLAALAMQAPGLLPATLGDPASREALAAALAQAQERGLLSEAQRQALQRAGLTPGKPGSKPTPGASAALARTLAAELAKRRAGLGTCKAGSAAEDFLARLNGRAGNCNGNGPGGGGVSRGPGTADLDQGPRDRTAGGEQAGLTPGATLNPDGSVTVAAQARDAEPDPAAREALQRAAAQAFDPAAADSRRAEVAPEHRAVVEAYFTNDEVHH
jgi:hypothetical protein